MADYVAPHANSKMELNTHCSKIIRRVMEKTVGSLKVALWAQDVIYETDEVAGGFQSQLRLAALLLLSFKWPMAVEIG